MSAATGAAVRTYLVEDDQGVPLSLEITYEDLAAVNDEDVMEEIDLLIVGEETVLGMCSAIKRVT